MINTQLINSDCLAAMKNMADNSVDSIVTDPPYGLSFMGKKWDYDVPSKEIWVEALRVLKPGGHLLAFSGSRTYHRMVINIEDAGFEIRDQIMWIYGSGFPKSHNISKAIDKAAGAEREVLGRRKRDGGPSGLTADKGWNDGPMKDDDSTVEITAPATPEAEQWDGWGTALKPAHEPIVLARKPIHSTVVDNVLEHGTGGLNIDDCRIETDEKLVAGGSLRINSGDERNGAALGMFQDGTPNTYKQNQLGRFPANVILDEEAGAMLDEQSGHLKSGDMNSIAKGGQFNAYGIQQKRHTTQIGDEGGASRFFYCAKASKAERDAGLEAFESKKSQLNSGGIGRKISVEKRLEEGEENAPTMKNIHPTVKPIRLMQYLCRLVTPKNGIVLDPFMGSGTTGIAANLEEFNFIGIEMDKEYVEIARARISHSGDYVIGEDLIMKRIKQPTLFDFAV